MRTIKIACPRQSNLQFHFYFQNSPPHGIALCGGLFSAGITGLPSLEGETTATYLSRTIKPLGVHVTLSTNPGVNTVVKGLPQTLYAMLRFGITDDITPAALLALIGA